MELFLAVLHNLVAPYWDTLKKTLAEKKISSLTILHAPNLVGHPLGLLILFTLGLFALPVDVSFYLFWFGMIAIASVQLTLNIWGLLETKFFGVQVLNKLGFVTTTITAVVLLGEQIDFIQWVALLLATVGITCFGWPRKLAAESITWDRGVLFIIISLVLAGFSSVFYKMATLYTPDYVTFLTGRFVGDLVGWTIVWVVGVICVNRLNPANEFMRVVRDRSGLLMIAGLGATTLLSSWLVYVLPISTYAVLGILTLPTSYIWSRRKYKENITPLMWVGTALIVSSILLFLSPSF